MTQPQAKPGRKRTGNIERRKGKPVYIRVILGETGEAVEGEAVTPNSEGRRSLVP